MDPWSLSFGIGFVLAGLFLTLVDLDFVHLRPSLWWPLPVLFTGLLVVLIALARTRARDDEAAGGPD